MDYKKTTTEITNTTKGKILFKDECYAIQGAIFGVYREMGCGFLESVYQECLEREFYRMDIPFAAQEEIKLTYKDEPMRQTFKPDMVCHEKIIVELKAVKKSLPSIRHKCLII